MAFKVPEKYRDKSVSNKETCGNNGLFFIPVITKGKNILLKVIASDGFGWDHVSVSTAIRCPIWNEMCFIKDLFWDNEDCVIQYHPPKSQYKNIHPFVLHLWKPQGIEIPMPPIDFV